MSERGDQQWGGGRQRAPLEAVRVFGDPTLKQQTRPVTVFDSRLQKLADTMMQVMDREDGVGLAAPQIGVLSRIMVWRDPEDEKARYVFVNPFVVARSEACTTAPEGCLSVPGTTVEVSRADEITVTTQDLEGVERTWELSGMLARIVQHEVDHLEGCLIVDRAAPEERRRVLKELRERAMSEDS